MDKRKTVGVITMHKVVNYGSALQSYALQRAVEKLGYCCLIIDYQYPNLFHLSKFPSRRINIIRAARSIVRKAIHFLFYKSKEQSRLFRLFWKKHYHQTDSYVTLDELRENPPEVDILLTGSDQVWNPHTMFGDPAFLCGFGEESIPRFSYGSSFSTDSIPENLTEVYRQNLIRYQAISVREHKGTEVIRRLLGREAKEVCDPTLLLTKEEYDFMAEESTVSIKEPYLLAYILDYAFNPYPAIQQLIDTISKKHKLRVVYLLCGNVNGFRPGAFTISASGPNEFLRLFRDASFVVTSSFHGTSFSIIFEKPFYAVVPSCQGKDSRIMSLLEKTELCERAVEAGEKHTSVNSCIDYLMASQKINEFRRESIDFLQNALSQ